MATTTPRSRDVQGSARPLTRVVVPAPGVTPEAFLASVPAPRGFWSRQGEWSAWSGSVREIRVDATGPADRYGAVRRQLSARSGAAAGTGASRWFGGMAFHPGHRPRGAWREFPAARFDLPAAELRGGEGDAPRLAVTVEGEGRAARDRAFAEAERILELASTASEGGAPDVAGGATDPGRGARGEPGPPREIVTRAAWRSAVEAALAAIAAGRFRKAVLARTVEIDLARPPRAEALLARLRTRDDGSFPFLFEPRPGVLFLGVSPELVAARTAGRFQAMAVAGTAPRSEDPAADDRLGRALLESAKDRSEHEISLRDMRERLAALGEEPAVDEAPHLLRLRGIQHLRTDLSVRAGPGRDVLDLLEAMHPTAAVSGYPREPAAAFLRATEGFDRGWYAGPVGWLDDAGDGVFAPALRCAVVRAATARLFAGAGIVEGSDPGREWDETSLKLRPALEILAPGGGRGA